MASYPSMADYYSNPATNPKGIVPTTSQAGGSVGSVAWARDLTSEQRAGALDYNQGDTYHGFVNAYNQFASSAGSPSMAPSSPGGGSSGGGYGYGYGGGGGGGGGAPAMTQAQFDAMLGILGTPTPGLDLQTVNLPTFRGVRIRPFQGQLYARMQNRLNRGVRQDRATVNRTTQQLRRQLRNDFSNPYQNAAYARTPQGGTEFQGVMAGTGADVLNNPYAESVNAENAYGQSSDAAFANLLGVLGASHQAQQQSRLAQVGMDRAEALRRIQAEKLGLGTGIDLARGKAKEAWQVRADERRYQNALTRQQWNREERMRNQDVRNLEAQTEYQTTAESRESRMQALLDLIGATTGTKLDLGGVQDLINSWGGSPTATRGGGRGGGGSEYTPREQARRHRYKRAHSGSGGGNAGQG